MDMSLSKLWETVKDREAWHAAVHGVWHESDTESDTIEWLNSKSIIRCMICNVYLERGIYIMSESQESSQGGLQFSCTVKLVKRFLWILISFFVSHYHTGSDFQVKLSVFLLPTVLSKPQSAWFLPHFLPLSKLFIMKVIFSNYPSSVPRNCAWDPDCHLQTGASQGRHLRQWWLRRRSPTSS